MVVGNPYLEVLEMFQVKEVGSLALIFLGGPFVLPKPHRHSR